MLIGADRIAMSGDKNPYMTDGLLAMYSGEWNDGYKKHDSTRTTWKDISGNGYDLSVVTAYAGFDTNSLRTNVDYDFSSCIAKNTSSSLSKYAAVRIIAKLTQTFIDWSILLSSPTYNNIAHYNGNTGFYNGGGGFAMSTGSTFWGFATYVPDGGLIKAYVNGKENALSSSGFTFYSYRPSSGICLGRNGDHSWHGNIYELSLYSSVPTEEYIERCWELDKARFGLS